MGIIRNKLIFILRNLKRRKYIFILIITVPLFLFIFPAKSLLTTDVIIFPQKDTGNNITAYNDIGFNGNSQVLEFSYDSEKLLLRYVLKEGATFPMVFITMFLDSSYKPVNLSHCTSVSFKIREATNTKILLFLKTFFPGISKPGPENGHLLRHNQYVLQLSPGIHNYSINLDEFLTAQWWLDMVKLDTSEIPEETFKNTVSFDMQFNQDGSNFIFNKPEQIIIEEISFHRQLPLRDCIFTGIIIFYYVIFIIMLVAGTIFKKLEQFPTQKPLDIPSYREKELNRIREFLEIHYTHADISTRMVYDKLGIPPFRVFKLIKEEYHLTFKQLINRMRINEAKRLLQTTDLRIIEIALQLGFNNISYFNNLFKTYEKTTPSEYRKNCHD